MIVLEDFNLSENNVCFLDNELSYQQAIEMLVDTFDSPIKERRLEVVEKILERERVLSTAVGGGIAIPHGRCDFLETFHLAIGIIKEDGISFDAMDGAPVQIVCLIAGPEEGPTRYLSFLSYITSLLKEEEVRREILFCESKKNIVNIFRSC